MREEVEFNWKDKETELQELIKNIVKEVNYHDKYYCKDCTAVLYWDGNGFVRYNCGALNDLECGPLRTIDFFHLSEERTKIIIARTGEDITDKVPILPRFWKFASSQR